MSASFYDLLKYAATGQASPDMTYYDRMRASTLMGGVVKTLTGQPPLSFKSDGSPLISWSMKGNGSQSGTPTPANPIQPEFVGTLDNSEWTIPITCAEQTTTVILGQTQTVRKIRKMVLDGTEGWQRASNGAYYLPTSECPHDYRRVFNEIVCICTHYIAQGNTTGSSGVTNNRVTFYASLTPQTYELYIAARDIASVTDFTAFLASEYSAGHPVTIWYILATPETAIINEPLCKIGTYADELSSEDAGVTIPTVKGSNTLTVDTELQPSEMSITYRG